MAFGIDRRARSTKGRGLFRRGPDAKDIGERLGRLAKRMEKSAFVRGRWQGERFVCTLALHPAAPHAVLAVEPDATVSLVAETGCIGPGYHEDVLARIAPMLDELDYAWVDEERDTRRAMCEWLAKALRDGEPLVERKFKLDGTLTMLGPRDAAWREAVLADPMRGRDAFAWWDSGPGHAAKARALLAMWHEVPWREALDDDERELMMRVDADLREARKAGLDVPYAEWAELLDHAGEPDEEIRAAAKGGAGTIGYRRALLELELSGGWWIDLHGGFVGKWEDDGARYWATDGDRAIEFTSLTANGEGDSDQLLAVAPERHPVIARISDGELRGRAEAHEEAGTHFVHGLMAKAPHVGILTCKSTRDEREWALATWRSLRLVDEA